MYNSDNINDELFNYYFNLGSIINSSCKMILKLENIYDVLFYINRNIENFNKDELILSKNILKTTKYIINKAKNQKNVKDEVLSYCDNLQNEIKDKLKTDEYNFIRNNPHLGNNITLLTLGGSHAYGTNIEGSDIDIRGCALNTKEELLLGNWFENVVETKTDTIKT